MVALQFAVSTTLLIGAGILVRTYLNAESARPAFDPTGVIATTLDVSQVQLDRPSGIRLYRDMMDRLSALPGVTAVSLTREPPLGFSSTATVIADPDGGTIAAGGPVVVAATAVSAQYFRTLGVAMTQGREFEETELEQPPVAIVNASMAGQLWPGASPLGRRFRLDGANEEPVEVIGVVPDLREQTRSQGSQAAFYRPFPHEYSAQMTLLMRVEGNTGPYFDEVRRTVRAVESDLSIVDLRTVDQFQDALVDQRRIPATALSLVGLLGLSISAVGLYGVVAYSVRRRARELAVRVALGARPADIRKLVLRQGFTVVGIGLAVGGAGAAGATLVIRAVLVGVAPLDLPMLATVCVVLLAAASAALYVPAQWASRLNPSETLRDE